MKKIILSLLISTFAISESTACTNFIVGKNASTDGSVICSYNADSYGMFIGLYHFDAGKHQAGEMRQIYDWDTNHYWGAIPEAAETYNVVGNMNEWQLTIAETTYGGREEMCDSTGIIDYGSLIYVTLQRAKTAREAIKTMTTLVETYGYNSEGETFTICDPNEAWVMEMQGKGPGSKGVVWVAQRIPDDCICAHANQSRIRVFPQGKYNKKNKRYEVADQCYYSTDCIKYARQMGWFTGKDAEFSWADAYAPADFGGRRFCDARVWSFFNKFSDDFSAYLPWALGKDPDAKPMPLWIKANRKVSVNDIKQAMRDHYEGTPLSLDKEGDEGQGIYDAPYRPTPLKFEVDGKTYFNERPISTQQSGFTFVAQMRSWMPRQIGGVFWFGNDDPNMVAFVPMYCSQLKQPDCFNTKGADATHFSMDNAYWVCNWVSNMTYPRYSMLFPSLKAVRDSLDNRYEANQAAIEAEAQKFLTEQGNDACVKYLNDYSVNEAQSMLKAWQDLATYLIVKFNDMAIKPEKDGKFELTKDGIGATVKRPGYTDRVKRSIANFNNGWYAVPE